ncbi:DnaB-like helicase C-terminal domain-containing protein [Bacillus sp. B15-48]|uniref:DnaB-like helicase C-terminal domain-containing protein n=1 Tax=Bacillus sp. B15-48 TaxID=1548601 RepID=UPI00193F84C3|nr:DnaB-like helicase C-terminal domain-containing protein [Bacillus sp. B15-48]MBM4764716.1 DNA helicase [Bacillus sp. B15-48]
MMVEKAFLGCLMKASYLIKDTVIRPEQLAETRNREIMQRMIEFTQCGKGIDLITMSMLENLESYGGISYFSELQAHADIEKFNEIEDLILDAWKEREKKNILILAARNDWEINKVISELDKINEIKVDDHNSITEALAEMYEAPWQEQELFTSATTGIKNLDAMMRGFHDGEVTILAARPSMGKTDVMLHFAKSAGWAGYLPIIFSLEMPEKLITSRLIASTGGINRAKMQNPNQLLSPNQKNKWQDVLGYLNETRIQIFDGPGQTVPEMRAKTRKMIHQFPKQKPIIFIDYLTLIATNQFYGGNSHLQVTEISRSLKLMAKEFSCPVVCLAQLNRNVESRANKRPMMSDIRESGSVEQDADIIVFLYREKYYDRSEGNPLLEFIVCKNRNGQVGTVMAKYNECTGRIEDLPE